MINCNVEVVRRFHGIKDVQKMSTKEVLSKLKSVRASRKRSTYPWSYRHKEKSSTIKALMNSFKQTGIENFYVFYINDYLYISRPNKFEYIFYNYDLKKILTQSKKCDKINTGKENTI